MLSPPRIAGLLAGLWLTAAAAGCAAQSAGTAHIVKSYPHDPAAFTEGLVAAGGVLFESTGGYGHSSLRRVDLTTGDVEQRRTLAARYFGEGLALAHGRLYQLTWKAHTGFVYAPDTLTRLGRFHYRGQGWGLTFDGQRLIMSDGSATLRFIGLRTFQTVARLTVTRNGAPVDHINELEYIDGVIWANVWFSDRILRIDAHTGHVLSCLDAAGLRRHLAYPGAAGVLNGIAWDAQSRRLLVTGKNWTKIFELAYPPGNG